MQSALSPSDRTVDVFDRTAALNFTCVLRVRGPLSEAALTSALRKLERRHPLLRARIERRPGGPVFAMNAAGLTPLHVLDGEVGAWQRLAERSLEHRDWADAGPRAELTWLRHGVEHSTLLLTLHHVVSDGHSGFVALRDLLGFVAEAELPSANHQAIVPIARPGKLSWLARAAKWLAKIARASKKSRARRELVAVPPPAPRAFNSPKLGMITFDVERTERMRERARAAGASLHALVCAAFAKGYVQAGDWERAPLRVCHPVDLRRYLDCTMHSETSRYADTIGCFVRPVETEHVVSANGSLPQLAQQITQSIRATTQADGPWLTESLTDPWLTRNVASTGDSARLGDAVKRYVMLDSFGVTSLGSVERIGLEPQVGRLHVEDAFFVSGASVETAMTAATSIYLGKLTIGLQWVDPLVSTATAEHILSSIEHELAAFARTELGTNYAVNDQARTRMQQAV